MSRLLFTMIRPCQPFANVPERMLAQFPARCHRGFLETVVGDPAFQAIDDKIQQYRVLQYF